MNMVTKPTETATALKPEVRIIQERCAGCQECVIRCPTQALSMDIINWKATADNDLCVGCRQCERTCPFSAISVTGPRLVAERTTFVLNNGSEVVGKNDEVRPGFANLEEAIREAKRCLNCPDPTCVLGCPAHNDIPRFIEAIRKRDLESARQILSKTSCLPDVCSRVCDWAKQCEGSCNWALAGGEPVAIGKLERFVTDNTQPPPVVRTSDKGKGLSVGIVGSGPAGIAAAWELASAGASVTIYEKGQTPGGVLQWGIPSYILPDKVSERPIKALQDAGVKIQTNTPVSPEVMERLLKTHDAVLAAQGAPVAERPNMPGLDLAGVIDATTFLTKAKRALADGTPLPELQGASVLVLLVLGGSDTAIDVARSIVRLGGKPVVIHRREEQFSRARRDEIAEAKNEGVEFRFATNIARLEGEDGKLKKAVIVQTHQRRADSPAEVVKGTEQALEVNAVVLATGYKVDPKLSSRFGHIPLRQPSSDSLFPDRLWLASGILSGNKLAGRLAWEREYGLRSAGFPKNDRLWLVGDALVGPSTVVSSMAQGRIAARAILERRTAN
jgi:glutamate synthase (NADPH/NADH) small chain